ncbi:MAG: hypothetical protein GKS00_19895 [Alphaproteobacteria bacterium]|nr:hypothetical protein [Alphaproteobacteria bacterium]
MSCCRLFRAVMFGAAALALVSGSAVAQKAKAPEKPAAGPKLVSSAWTVGCRPAGKSQDLLCEASQTIALAESRQTLLGVYVTPWKQAGKPDSFILRYQLPHGLNFPAGVQVKIDDKAAPAPEIQTSNQVGVFARTDLTDPLLASLKKGAAMTVEFSSMNGNKLAIPVTLKGFSAVFEKLK